MNHKLDNDMKMRKGNGNTITILSSLEGLEMLYQERREQMNTIVMESFHSMLLYKSGPANKQDICQSV